MMYWWRRMVGSLPPPKKIMVLNAELGIRTSTLIWFLDRWPENKQKQKS